MKKINKSKSSKYIGVLPPNTDFNTSGEDSFFNVKWKLCDSEEAAKEWLNSNIEGTFNFEKRDRLYGMFESDTKEYCDLVECGSKDPFFSVLDDGNVIQYEPWKSVKELKRFLKEGDLTYEYDEDYEIECWTDQWSTRLKVWRINNHEELTSLDQIKESSRKSQRSSLRENSREDKVLFEALTDEAFGAYDEENFFEHVNRDWYEGTSIDLILNKKDKENNWKGLLQGKIKDIVFIADEAGIDPQESLIFYDEDGNVIYDAYALLYDTDEVFNESSRKSQSSLRENYLDFDYAYYKTKRIASSLCKEFDTNTVKMAFDKVSEEL